jgi:prepilin peptidase CpaA
MGLTAATAYWFIPVAIPIAIFVSWSDMKRMKIPNIAVYTLVLCYAVLGLLALPFTDYLWHWTHLFVVLALGIVLNAIGAMGAGDAKFMAAAAPMISLGDIRQVMALFAACLLAGYATHRLARMSPIRKMTPDWESWTAGKRFPMGFPLSMTLVFYLLWVAIYR